MRTPQSHTAMSVEGATRENARSRFVRGRVVGATAIASAASVVIDNAVVGWVELARLRGPDQGGARLPRRPPGPRSRSPSAWRR